MPRLPPPPSGPAAGETIAEHIRIGRRMIAHAMAAHEDLELIGALIAWEEKGGPLDPSTVSRYRSDLRYALMAEYEARGDLAEFERNWPAVDAALSARRETIPKEDWRTSAKKVEDATEQEARALFAELKRHALAHGNMNAVLAALFVLVARHFGYRPVELRGAQVNGTQLIMPNAKKRPGKPLQRAMEMNALEEDVQLGIKMMIALIDHDLTKREFARWQKVLAEQMRRACKRINIRTLSLYSFRHVAIASWSAAGLSPAEVAELCGHTSIRTAHTHYARAGVGHKRKSTVRAVRSMVSEATQQLIDSGIENTSGVSIDTHARAVHQLSLDVDDMPTPASTPADKRPATAMANEAIAAGLARHVDPRSAEEIGASLRNARKQAAGSPSAKALDRKTK